MDKIKLKGDRMIDVQALMRVRQVVESNLGEKVRLKVNRGRRKCLVQEGIINDVYPSIFTIRINIDGRAMQTLAYTYSDILTSDVEVVVCKNNERI
ncbi:MAG: Veg protein [Clostridiales bacterium]|nr:Veg protein [Clostridiales bacterium]